MPNSEEKGNKEVKSFLATQAASDKKHETRSIAECRTSINNWRDWDGIMGPTSLGQIQQNITDRKYELYSLGFRIYYPLSDYVLDYYFSNLLSTKYSTKYQVRRCRHISCNLKPKAKSP